MNWLSRTELLLGEERLGLLKNAHVLVAGLGGVGALQNNYVGQGSGK